MVAGGLDGAGERLLRTFLTVWDDPVNRQRFIGLFRRVIEPDGGRLLGDGFVPVVLGPVGQALGIDHPELRMPLVASQMIGLIADPLRAADRAAGLDGRRAGRRDVRPHDAALPRRTPLPS